MELRLTMLTPRDLCGRVCGGNEQLPVSHLLQDDGTSPGYDTNHVLLGLVVLYTHGGVWVDPSVWWHAPLSSVHAVHGIIDDDHSHAHARGRATHRQRPRAPAPASVTPATFSLLAVGDGLAAGGTKTGADAGTAHRDPNNVAMIAARKGSNGVRRWLERALAARANMPSTTVTPLSVLRALIKEDSPGLGLLHSPSTASGNASAHEHSMYTHCGSATTTTSTGRNVVLSSGVSSPAATGPESRGGSTGVPLECQEASTGFVYCCMEHVFDATCWYLMPVLGVFASFICQAYLTHLGCRHV